MNEAPETAATASAASAIPEVVDSERSVARRDFRNHPSHHRDTFEGRLQLVRPVALVAEENRVEAGAGEDLDVPPHRLDDCGRALPTSSYNGVPGIGGR